MPWIIDIFRNRAFSAVELTAALEDIEFVPEMLGVMGEALFPTVRSRFRQVAVTKTTRGFSLVPVSPIGAPPVELEQAGGNVRPFFTRRLAKGSTLYAEELQGVVQMPEMDQIRTIQSEIAQRAVRIREDIELTNEHMRFGAILGKVVDADGVTVLDDWFANWGVAEPTPINFALGTSTTNVRAKADQVRRQTRDAAPGAWINGRTVVHALCGGTFFDMLLSHPMVERTYLQTPQAGVLREMSPDEVTLFGIVWHRWQGMADGAFSIAANEARFFPVGARTAFQRVLGPAEFEPFINTPGRDIYGMTIPDRDRQMWTRVEAYQYPLYVCLRPEMLQRAVAS